MDSDGITLLFGGPGTGKSVLLVNAMVESAKHGPTLILDITGDIEKYLRKAMPKDQTIIRVTSPDDYARTFRKSFFNPSPEVGKNTHVLIGLPPREKRKGGETMAAVGLWLALVIDPIKRVQFPFAFSDESDQLFPSSNQTPQEFKDSMLVARNEGRSLFYAVKRPTALTPTVRSLSTRACVFRLISDADAKACAELGPSKLFPPEIVLSLPVGQYLYYDAREHRFDSTLATYDAMHDAPPFL